MKQAMVLPAFMPDQSGHSEGLSEANNVYPKVDGYGPLAGFAAFTPALGSSFMGGSAFIAKDGTSSLLVGTAANLRKFTGGAWSTLVTMGVTMQWRFAQFGNYVIGVNGADTKVVDLVAGTASTLTGAPVGTSIAIVGDYVVIGQDSSDKLGITTSAEGDHTDWDVVTSTATYQPMLAGGEVMGLASGEFGVILQRQRLVRMTRTGNKDAPFQYDVITENVGCASQGSVAQFANMVFFLADSGFKMLSAGQELRNIGSEKVDRTFIAQVPRDNWDRIYSAIDPQSKVVIWCNPGSPGSLWIYNWELDRWATATLAMDGVFSGFTSSIDLDTLAATYPDLDAMGISLDDPRWAGGNPRLYVVQAQQVGTFSGVNLEAALTYSFVELTPGRVARVRSIRPLTDAIDGNGITLDTRARLGDAMHNVAASGLRGSGIMPVRASGRYIKTRWLIASGTAWSFAQGLEYDVEVGGER